MARRESSKPLVVFSILGTTLDRANRAQRWERWRPTVDLCRHDDLVVKRLELIYPPPARELAELVAQDVGSVSPETEVCLRPLDFSDPWDFEEVYGGLLDFTRGYRFRPEKERYLVHMTTGTHVAQICWFLLAESRHVPGALIQTSPPKKRGVGQVGKYSIIDLDLSRYDRIAQRFGVQTRDNLSFLKSGIDTKNAAFNRLIEHMERVVKHSKAPLLITGPTGAGKSLLAKKIYALRKQQRQVEGQLVEVNCATLRGDGAMSTLFGHKKGAFTGAVGDRPGLLMAAHQGVLFLDEIGELGLDEQAMLLRALEDKRFLPVGSDREVESDFTLIAGTNRDLWLRVEEGRFREDLLARINLWTFELPGLAARPEDVAPNLEYELDRFEEAEGRKASFNREARERFLTFATGPEGRWPGNFRDFNAAVTRMCTLAPGGRVDVPTVEEEVSRLRAQWRSPSARAAPGPVQPSLPEHILEGLDLFDRVQLEAVAGVCREAKSLSDVGRVLFAESRKKKANPNDADRLRKYLARFGLTFADVSS
ncbi:MAG: RNA repair transcriptional activator RtcR [Myxococcales bacterium]|nr:RNA repair transcriptional activator RtcR [Myxococcales bacterium]